jgi:GH24 family phage-related lysozyme (muramidase)
MLVGGALLFAVCAYMPSASAADCYLTVHGDIQCPSDPEAEPGKPIPEIGMPPWIPPPLESSPPILGIGTCEKANPLDTFREHAKSREGYSTKVYLDSLGKPTVGIGHLVTEEDELEVGDEISAERVNEFWLRDSMMAFNASVKQAEEAGICDFCFVAAMASVNYQLGTGWRKKFPVTWALIVAGRYNDAADELDKSLWKKQTPVRVRDFQMALRALPPKAPDCIMEPPIELPPKLCDIVPEMCNPICYGDLCHCKMEPPLPGEDPVSEPVIVSSTAAVATAPPVAAAPAEGGGQCYPVTDCQVDVTPGNFLSALNGNDCGCTLNLGPGSYPKFTYSKKCTPANPMILKAKAGGVKFNQGINVQGNGGIFVGFEIGGGIVAYTRANDNRLTRSLFTGPSRVLYNVGSSRNRFDHNDVVVPGQAGSGSDAGNFIAFDAFWSPADGIYNNRVDSNFFTTTSGSKAEYQTGIFHGINTGACMLRGFAYVDTPWGHHNTLIENNLWDKWERRRVFEIKGSGIVIRNNTISNTTANSLYRHGMDGTITGNYFENAKSGLSIREYNHKIENNMFINSKLELYAGSRSYNQCGRMCFKDRPWFPGGIPQGAPAVKTYINNNKGPLVIGEIAGSGCIVPATDTTIGCHDGSITKKVEKGTTGPTSTSCSVTATKLTKADVGRSGPEGSCAPPIYPEICSPEPGTGPLPPGLPVTPGPGIELCYPSDGKDEPTCGENALRDALAAAQPGDRIEICSGNYGGTYSLNKNGTESVPIVVAAASGATVTFTGMFNMNGSYGVLEGVTFKGSGKMTMDGHHNRVTRSKFINVNSNAIKMNGNGHNNNRIDHNEFLSFVGTAIEISTKNGALNAGHRVDTNLFKDHRVDDSEEVARMLGDAYHDSKLIYENNLFDNVLQGRSNQAEMISMKTGGVIARGNTVINSGRVIMSLRVSNRSLIENNYFGDGSGIRVFGDNHVIQGNMLAGGAIEVHSGDGTMDDSHPGCDTTGRFPLFPDSCKIPHAVSRNTTVSNNTGRIIVGDNFGGDNIPASGTRGVNNSGPISYDTHTNSDVKTGTPSSKATALTADQVGIGAEDPLCPGD